jgi:hypothetical protein
MISPAAAAATAAISGAEPVERASDVAVVVEQPDGFPPGATRPGVSKSWANCRHPTDLIGPVMSGRPTGPGRPPT